MSAREFLRSNSPVIVLGGLTVFTPLIDGGTTHFPVFVIRLILLTALTAWVIGAMKAGRLAVQQTPLYLAVAVFLGWAVFSACRSSYTAISIQWVISLFSYAVMLFLVLNLLESLRQVRGLVVIVLGMGLFEAALGAHQFAWAGRARPAGTFFNPNFFASYEVAVFAVAFGLLCFRRREDGVRWETPVLWLAAGGSAVGFLLAQSRGALLALVAAVTFVGVSRFGRVFGAVLLLVLLIGALVPNPLQKRMLTIEAQDPYALTRLDIWKNSLQRIADHPWGVGLGLYRYTSFQYRFPIENGITRYGKRAETAHNEYLQTAVELGVIGVVLWGVGIALLSREIYKTMKSPLEPWERGLVVGLSGGIVGILVHGAVDSVFHEPALVLLGILFAGMILVMKRLKSHAGASVWLVPFPYHPARVALVGACAVLLSFLIIRPAAAWYAYDKGLKEEQVGREDRALYWLQRATLIDPGTTVYRDALALAAVRLYYQTDDPMWLLQAVEELGIGLDLNPLDGRLAQRLGTLYALLATRAEPGMQRGTLLEKAAAYYEQAIRLDPYSPFNYLELGKVRWAEGRVDEAQALFRRATSYEPNFLPARVQSAELALKMGRKREAASEYAEIATIKERYRGHVLNALERQYLEVESDHLEHALGAVDVP